ncbi:hypothetical protein Hanom_Chr04g00323341 [Helianthus anomalus]
MVCISVSIWYSTCLLISNNPSNLMDNTIVATGTYLKPVRESKWRGFESCLQALHSPRTRLSIHRQAALSGS